MAEGCAIITRRLGAKRSISSAQLASSEAGATRRLGRFGVAPLRFLDPREGALEPLAIDLDPLPADEREAVGAREERLHFGRRQCLTVECDLHLEVEQRVTAYGGRSLAPDRGAHPRSRRTS